MIAFLSAGVVLGLYAGFSPGPLITLVVADAAVQQAVRKRAPFVQQSPHSAAAECIQAWANRIHAHVDGAGAVGKSGFFSRLASWWR